MSERSDHTCCLSAEVVSFVIGLSKQKQRKVIDLVERIAASLEFISDYQTPDAQGRPIENLLLEEFLFAYWIDHASKEIQITEIFKV